MSVTVPQRREGESDLDYLRRKETLWGLWQADALERMEQQGQTIDALKHRIVELEACMASAKVAAESFLHVVTPGLYDPSPDNIQRDLSGHINLMFAQGVPEYAKGKQSCRHINLRSRAPRKN